MNLLKLAIFSLFVAAIWGSAQAQVATDNLLQTIDSSLEESFQMTCVHDSDDALRVRCSRRTDPRDGFKLQIDVDKHFFYVKARTFGKLKKIFPEGCGEDHLCGSEIAIAGLAYLKNELMSEAVCDLDEQVTKATYKKGECHDVYGKKSKYKIISRKTKVGETFSYIRIDMPR